MTETTTATLQDKVVVVTGGGSGIGKSLCFAFAHAGAFVVVTDVKGSSEVQAALPSSHRHMAIPLDVTNPNAVAAMIASVKKRYHKIDIYCSNAGILIPSNPRDDSCTKHSLQDWNRIVQVNVLSHVTALRELLPDWERGIGDGHFCVTASAAGLLTMVGDASYGVSKAAALSFCEHVAIAHGNCVQVHCLCPQGVSTNLAPFQDKDNAAMSDGMLTPEEVAVDTLQAIQRGDFFIFPHANVPKYALRKAKDHARWLKGMQRLRNNLMKSKL